MVSRRIGDHSLDFLSSLLKMSDFFMIDDARHYALTHLRNHPEFEVTLKLQFCQRYKLEDWLEPAFRELMKCQLADISGEGADRIPRRIYHTYVTAKHEINCHRLSLGFEAPPAINDPQCNTPATCCYHWRLAWADGPAKMFNHPDHHYLVMDVLWALRTTDIPHICKSCYKLCIEQVEGSDEMQVEDRIIDNKVEDLKKWLGKIL